MSEINSNQTIDSLWLFRDTEAPSLYRTSLRIAKALNILAVFYFLVITLALLARILEENDRRKRTHKRTRLLLWTMLAVSSISLATQIVNIPMIQFRFGTGSGRIDPIVCEIGMKLTAFLYVASMGANYFYLSKKAKVLLSDKKSHVYKLYLLTHFSAVYGCVALCVACLIAFHGNLRFSEGYCTNDLAQAIVWFFLASDTSVSLCFIFLFYWPMRQHFLTVANTTRGCSKLESETMALMKVAKNNFKLGLIQIASTFVVQVSGIVLTSVFIQSEENAFLEWIRYSGYIVDMVINLTALLLTNKAWYPRFLRARIDKVSPNQSSSVRDLTILSGNSSTT